MYWSRVFESVYYQVYSKNAFTNAGPRITCVILEAEISQVKIVETLCSKVLFLICTSFSFFNYMLAIRISGTYLNPGVLPKTALGKDKQSSGQIKKKFKAIKACPHESNRNKVKRNGKDLVLRLAHEISYYNKTLRSKLDKQNR